MPFHAYVYQEQVSADLIQILYLGFLLRQKQTVLELFNEDEDEKRDNENKISYLDFAIFSDHESSDEHSVIETIYSN